MTAPEEEAVKFPIFAVACEASCSSSPLDFLASPSFWVVLDSLLYHLWWGEMRFGGVRLGRVRGGI